MRGQPPECNGLEIEIRPALTEPPTIPQNHKRPDLKYLGQAKITMDRILECAVVLNWKELTNPRGATSIQVEYRTGTSRSLELVKFWSSTTRGFWQFVCNYQLDSSSTQERGTTFGAGYGSTDLVWMMDAIMQHQDAFVLSPSEFLDGLIQVGSPSETELIAAGKDMSDAMDRIGSLPAHT